MSFYFFILILILYIALKTQCVRSLKEFNLTIIHFNDFEARFLPIDIEGKLCKSEDVAENCFAGFGRLKQKIHEVREKYPDALLFNAGGFCYGTMLSSVYGWNISSYFLNQLPHTAFTLGTQEMELGRTEDLEKFIESLKTPVINCNIEDEATFGSGLKKSIVINVHGHKIGITGYISTAARLVSSMHQLEFLDEKMSVQNEALRLRREEDVSSVLVLGYGGYDMDLEIAKLPEVDIVIGGKSATFLFTGNHYPSTEIPVGLYPTVVSRNGTSGLVVQAYRYGKYLGFLQVSLNPEGRCLAWSGNPYLIDHTVLFDDSAVEDIDSWNSNLTSLRETTVGYTHVFLDGSIETCGIGECNMGNLISDSMVYMSLVYATDFQWNYVSIGIHDAGGIQGSIDEAESNGIIKLDDLYRVIPYRNSIDFVEIKGLHIRQVMEHSAEKLHLKPERRFLQVSGLQVTYDICQKPGSRVKNILVACKECRLPQYQVLEDEKYYQVVLPRYLATGGNGYKIIDEISISHQQTESVDIDVLKKYLEERGPVITGVEGRIIITGDPSCFHLNNGNLPIPILLQIILPFYLDLYIF